MARCICEVRPDAPAYHSKKRKGTLSTHRAAKHLSTCPHSTLKATTRKFKPRKVKRVPGTRKLIAVDDAPEPRKTRAR